MKTTLYITSETDAATITAEGTNDEIDALIEMYVSEGFDVEIWDDTILRFYCPGNVPE